MYFNFFYFKKFNEDVFRRYLISYMKFDVCEYIRENGVRSLLRVFYLIVNTLFMILKYLLF